MCCATPWKLARRNTLCVTHSAPPSNPFCIVIPKSFRPDMRVPARVYATETRPDAIVR